MIGSHVSAFSKSTRRILIVSLNWVGDCIMAMPALQILRERNPDASITVATRRSLIPLWEMHDAVDHVLETGKGFRGMMRSVCAVRREKFDGVYVLPNSFRSALVPFLAGVPQRVGFNRGGRGWMLTERPPYPDEHARSMHQSAEMASLLLGITDEGTLPYPKLTAHSEAQPGALKWAGDASVKKVGLIPGAARGPSKQWPESHFVELAQMLEEGCPCRFLLQGTAAERELCGRIQAAIGKSAVSLAGQTSFSEWAAVLQKCDVVIANDSGGMHLAAALGRPVIGLFGLTDVAKTGPLGPSCVVKQEAAQGRRDVKRASFEAVQALSAITPQDVLESAISLLDKEGAHSAGT